MKILSLLMMLLLLTACGKPQTIQGHYCDTYGLLSNKPKDCLQYDYRTDIGSIVAAVIFSETIIVPIYCIGFDLKEPLPEKLQSKCALNPEKCK